MPKPSSKQARRALAAAATVVVALLGYGLWYWYRPLAPGAETILVKPGTSLRAFARELTARGILPEPHTFVWIAHLTGRGRGLKAGEYRFAHGLSAGELLAQVVAGRVVEYPLAVIEGWTFAQLQRAVTQAPKLERRVVGLSGSEIMTLLGAPNVHPEGQFYPDTYYYTAGHTDLSILKRAYERMQVTLRREWEARTPGLPIATPYEALILASIVEKETGRPDERELIAGVFVNRLRANMRLQTDPSVIYGLGERFDGNLRTKDLRTDGPYNTYLRRGLPPTPIAMPGAAAIRAALRPADTRALYFVSRGDGGHVFSESLAEHNQAVVRYQLGGKPRASSSSPADGGPNAAGAEPR